MAQATWPTYSNTGQDWAAGVYVWSFSSSSLENLLWTSFWFGSITCYIEKKFSGLGEKKSSALG